jgi:hypothetical protein
MSRLVLGCSLVLALSSLAAADRAYEPALDRVQTFAQPPAGVRRVALDRATVRAALAHAREQNLAAFRAYQRKGVFPSNTYANRELNVWRDAAGQLCAAATIIAASGQTALVERIAEQNNFIRLADVTQGPVLDWILTSGFTQDELVAIQKPFRPVMKDPGIVDGELRSAETARLIEKYNQVDAMLVKNQDASLDAATDRLMKRPALAWQIGARAGGTISAGASERAGGKIAQR